MSADSLPSAADLTSLFERCGLDAKNAESTAKNSKLAAQFYNILKLAGLNDNKNSIDKSIGIALYTVATKIQPSTTPAATTVNLTKLINAISKDKTIKTIPQVDGAIKYFKKLRNPEEFNQKEFEASSGIGINITAEDIKNKINEVFTKHNAELIDQRYRFAGKLLGIINEQLQWADGATLKKEFDKKIEETIGPKTDDDTKKVKQPKPETKAAETSAEAKTNNNNEKNEKDAGFVPPAEINWLEAISGRELADAINTKEQLEAHLAVTNGKTRTRFPPEPNGYLHIGHAKGNIQKQNPLDYKRILIVLTLFS